MSIRQAFQDLRRKGVLATVEDHSDDFDAHLADAVAKGYTAIAYLTDRGREIAFEHESVLSGKFDGRQATKLGNLITAALRDYGVPFDWNGDGGKTDRDCLNRVLEGLKLLERDALGGSGSRGYGRVRVEKLKVDERDVQADFDAIVRFDPDQPAALAGV